MKSYAEDAESQTRPLRGEDLKRLGLGLVSRFHPGTESPNARSILTVLRLISWFSASLIYLASGVIPSIPFKLILVFGLLIEGLVAEYFYILWAEDSIGLAALIGAETIGICVLLLPTGGLASPFIWYALNLVFAASSLLTPTWCYGISASLVLSALFGNFLIDPNFSLKNILRSNAFMLFSFVALTIAAQQTAKLVNRLSDVCHDLEQAQKVAEGMAHHTRALYQALEACSSQDNTQHLADLFASYSAILTGSKAGFCILWEDSAGLTASIHDPEVMLPPVFTNLATKDFKHECNSGTPSSVLKAVFNFPEIRSEDFLIIPLEASCINWGVLGCFQPGNSHGSNGGIKSLQFLAELGTIVIERRQLEDLSARLRVAEEQNRIANEIHDGVSQYLFGLSCGLHSLSAQDGYLQEEAVQKEFDLLKRTASHASRELRASIYRISPAKRGEHLFVSEVDSFLKDQANLNEIKITFTPAGSEDAVSPALRKALFRLIRETTSNAIRHGKADDINISLNMAPHKVNLDICDNGQGFDLDTQEKQGFPGIGLMSMRSLMDTFDGSIDITSSPGNGTKVSFAVPAER